MALADDQERGQRTMTGVPPRPRGVALPNPIERTVTQTRERSEAATRRARGTIFRDFLDEPQEQQDFVTGRSIQRQREPSGLTRRQQNAYRQNDRTDYMLSRAVPVLAQHEQNQQYIGIMRQRQALQKRAREIGVAPYTAPAMMEYNVPRTPQQEIEAKLFGRPLQPDEQAELGLRGDEGSLFNLVTVAGATASLAFANPVLDPLADALGIPTGAEALDVAIREGRQGAMNTAGALAEARGVTAGPYGARARTSGERERDVGLARGTTGTLFPANKEQGLVELVPGIGAVPGTISALSKMAAARGISKLAAAAATEEGSEIIARRIVQLGLDERAAGDFAAQLDDVIARVDEGTLQAPQYKAPEPPTRPGRQPRGRDRLGEQIDAERARYRNLPPVTERGPAAPANPRGVLQRRRGDTEGALEAWRRFISGEEGKLGREGEEQNPVRPEDITGEEREFDYGEMSTNDLGAYLTDDDELQTRMSPAQKNAIADELERRAAAGDERARFLLESERSQLQEIDETTHALDTRELNAKLANYRNELERQIRHRDVLDIYARRAPDDESIARTHAEVTEAVDDLERQIDNIKSELRRREGTGELVVRREEPERPPPTNTMERLMGRGEERLTIREARRLPTSQLWSESMNDEDAAVAIRELQRRVRQEPAQQFEAEGILRRIVQRGGQLEEKGLSTKARDLIRKWMGSEYGRLGDRGDAGDIIRRMGIYGDPEEYARSKGFRDVDEAQRIYDGSENHPKWDDARDVMEVKAQQELTASGMYTEGNMPSRGTIHPHENDLAISEMERRRYQMGIGGDPLRSGGQSEFDIADADSLFNKYTEAVEMGDEEGAAQIEAFFERRAASGADPTAMKALNEMGDRLTGDAPPFSNQAIVEANLRLRHLRDQLQPVLDKLDNAMPDEDNVAAAQELIPFLRQDNAVGDTARSYARTLVEGGPHMGSREAPYPKMNWLKKYIPGELGRVGRGGRRLGLDLARRGTGAGVGAAAGATQGDTPQERLKNALLGAGAGLGVADILIRTGLADQVVRELGQRGERGALGRAGDEGREAAREGYQLGHLNMDEWARFKGFRDFDHAQQVYDEGVESASGGLGHGAENWDDARTVVEESARRELQDTGISDDYFADRRFLEDQPDIERTGASLDASTNAFLGGDDPLDETAFLSPLSRTSSLQQQNSAQLIKSWEDIEAAGAGMGAHLDLEAQQQIEAVLARRAASGADPDAMRAINQIREFQGSPEPNISERLIAEAERRLVALEAEFNRIAQGTLAVGVDISEERLRALIPYAQLQNPVGNRARFILRQQVARGVEWLKKFIPGERGALGRGNRFGDLGDNLPEDWTRKLREGGGLPIRTEAEAKAILYGDSEHVLNFTAADQRRAERFLEDLAKREGIPDVPVRGAETAGLTRAEAEPFDNLETRARYDVNVPIDTKRLGDRYTTARGGADPSDLYVLHNQTTDPDAQAMIEGQLERWAANGDDRAMKYLNNIDSASDFEPRFSLEAIKDAEMRATGETRPTITRGQEAYRRTIANQVDLQRDTGINATKAIDDFINATKEDDMEAALEAVQQLGPIASIPSELGRQVRDMLRNFAEDPKWRWISKHIGGERGALGGGTPVERLVREMEGSGMELVPQGPNRLAINDFQVTPKGKGLGRAALEKLTRLADELGVSLEGAPLPTQPGGLNKRQLEEWYARHGFEVTGESEVGPDVQFIERQPRTKPQARPRRGERGALGGGPGPEDVPEPKPTSRHEAELPNDVPVTIKRVSVNDIDIEAQWFQGRKGLTKGKSYNEARVRQIEREFDPNAFEPITVVRTPGKPGRYTVLSGHHRLEVARRKGIDIDIRIADLDLGKPEDLQQAMLLADIGNTGQATLNLADRINIIRRMGTEDVGEIKARHRAFTDQQIRDAIYVQEMPQHVVDKLTQLNEGDPLVGIAAELGRGVREYGYSPQEAEGLLNRLTKGIAKGNLPTPARVREIVDKFGPIFRERQQLGMFAEDEDFGGSNRLLDAMLEYNKVHGQINREKNELVAAIKGALKLDVPADDPAIVNATAKIQELEARLAGLEDEFLTGLRAEPASAQASSTLEAGGIARTFPAGVEGEATQPPRDIFSTTSDVEPSGTTTRQTEPSRNLRDETTIEKPTGPTIAPPGQMLFAPTEEETAHLRRLINEGDWTDNPGARTGAMVTLNMLERNETPSAKQMDLLNRALTGRLPAQEGAVPPRRPPTDLGGQRAVQRAQEALVDAIRSSRRLTAKERGMLRTQAVERGESYKQRVLEGVAPERRGQVRTEEAPQLSVKPITAETVHRVQHHLTYGDWTELADERLTAGLSLQRLLLGEMPDDAGIDMLERAIPGLGRAILSKRNVPQKMLEEAIGLLGVPQSLSTFLDASAGLRQAAPLGSTHPGRWANSVLAGGRATFSAAEATRRYNVIRELASRGPINSVTGEPVPGLSFLERGGRLSDLTTTASEREAQFASLNRSMTSRLLRRTPFMAPSEQNYVTVLNDLRTNVYNDVAQDMWDTGVRDPEQYAWLARVVNHGSGWGDFKPGQITKGLNAFFSARNLSARFQVLVDPFIAPGSLLKPSARQQAAKNLIGFAGYNTAVLGMLAGIGAATGAIAVEMNPLSSDWGKARIGKSRVDLTAGYGPMFRYFARMANGSTKLPDGRIVPTDRKQLSVDFLRGKFGPIPGAFVDWAEGKSAIGEDVDFSTRKGLSEQAIKRMTPLFVQDVVAAYKENPLTGIALAPAAFFGASVQTYAQPSREAQERIKKHDGDYRAALLEADQQNQEDVGNSIRAAWQRDFGQRGQEFGLEVVPGNWEERKSAQLNYAPIVEAWPETYRAGVGDEIWQLWEKNGHPEIGQIGREAILSGTTPGESERAYIDAVLPEYLRVFPDTLKDEAEADIKSSFGSRDRQNEYDRDSTSKWKKFWTDHTDLLQEAIDIGLPTHIDNADEDKILGR